VADHRFVTLIGAGGIGKTQLALEVARHLLSRFPDGVWIVELAPLSDPQLVPVYRRDGGRARTRVRRHFAGADRSGARLKAHHARTRQLRTCHRGRSRNGRSLVARQPEGAGDRDGSLRRSTVLKDARRTVRQLLLPVVDLVRADPELPRQLGDGAVALDCLSATFALNPALCFFRVRFMSCSRTIRAL